jgi:hypothetical protein
MIDKWLLFHGLILPITLEGDSQLPVSDIASDVDVESDNASGIESDVE